MSSDDGAQPTIAAETFLSAQPRHVVSGAVAEVSEAHVLWGELENYEGAYLQARLTLVTLAPDVEVVGTWYDDDEVDALKACDVPLVAPLTPGSRYAVGIEFVDVVDEHNEPHPEYSLASVGSPETARYLPPADLAAGAPVLLGVVRTIGLGGDDSILQAGEDIGTALAFLLTEGDAETYTGQDLSSETLGAHMDQAFASVRSQVASVYGQCLGWGAGSGSDPPAQSD